MDLLLLLVRSTSLHWIVLGRFGEAKEFLPSLEASAQPSFGMHFINIAYSQVLIGPRLISSPFANGATFLGFEMAARMLDRI
jgi:hypothetical protein